uniref:Uncharacterized protein n=2 Tax=Micrurus TaxID=8634 RepID=A0A2D4EN85_MICCO
MRKQKEKNLETNYRGNIYMERQKPCFTTSICDLVLFFNEFGKGNTVLYFWPTAACIFVSIPLLKIKTGDQRCLTDIFFLEVHSITSAKMTPVIYSLPICTL